MINPRARKSRIILIRLTQGEYDSLLIRKGDKSTSEYVRELIQTPAPRMYTQAEVDTILAENQRYHGD